jgi:hypothetical protein
LPENHHSDSLFHLVRLPGERKLSYLTPESTFKIVLDTFGKVKSTQEQNEIMKSLTYIPFKVDESLLHS